MRLEEIRAELPLVERTVYLNAGTFGPLPRTTVDAMRARLERDLVAGRWGTAYFEEVLELRERVRRDLAELIGAPTGSVALTSSTTEGCNIAVNGLRLGPDDEVVTTDLEHPGLMGALVVSGARLRVVELRSRPASEVFSALEAAVTPRTRLIAVSHVAWTTGAVLPVRELAEIGVPLLVDGAQSVGAISVDVAELACDFYTVSGQKWLLGPDSTGCLYIRESLVGELALTFPSFVSWERGTYVPKPGAERFDPGWIPPASLEGLAESIAFARRVGENRFARARDAAARCRELVAARASVVTDPDQATLVSFRPREEAAALTERLARLGIAIRDLPELNWARASVGFWTSADDLDRFAEALS